MTRKYKQMFSIAFIIMMTITTAGYSQFTKSVSVEMVYDDNSFRNYKGLSDYITQVNVYLARDFQSEALVTRLYYDGNVNVFTEYSDRLSHHHKVGAAFSRFLGSKGEALNFGANIRLSRYRDVYDYSNYGQATGYANFKAKPDDAIITQFGYVVKYRDYENLPEFSHFEHQLFGRFSWFLPTSTSLILYTRYGLKDYETQTVVTGARDMSNIGHGRGGRQGESGGVVISEQEAPSASQFIGSLKFGQSLSSITGLSFQYLRRINLSDAARYSALAGEIWNYNTEDDLFDDPYAYQGHEMSTVLTQLLPWQTRVKMGYDRYIKNYGYEALDLNGEPLLIPEDRRDTRNVVWFNLTKQFSQKSAFRNFELSLDFYYLNNNSNDPYFNYDSSVFTFGTGFSF
ncbi:hypothetical protein GWO43_25715 [candidate division KSB1 bacterium]|nr:hypothetical protein [candidate division KSB1 bacterium]NIR69207.1 hypothetical protein [candidate division KSB1 bacterium]NIS27384.1 hypothetical protein [candidate division KSB1 bacterium]NIT74209.1 hypothetical protein [candidate division KSB1 bacterium]NIU28101.1 hypothetical protein [candidate division KSB1 bacterium]